MLFVDLTDRVSFLEKENAQLKERVVLLEDNHRHDTHRSFLKQQAENYIMKKKMMRLQEKVFRFEIKSWPENIKYIGKTNNINNNLEGNCTYCEKNGIINDGLFVDGLLQKGIRIFPCGTIQEGDFINGCLQKGIWLYPCGTIDDGEFINEEIQKGYCLYPSGTLEEGEFVDESLQKGAVLFPDGTLDFY